MSERGNNIATENMVNIRDGKVESSTSRGMQNVGAMMQVVCALPGLGQQGYSGDHQTHLLIE